MPDNNPKGLDLKPAHIERFKEMVGRMDKPCSVLAVQFDPDGGATAALIHASIEHLGKDVAMFYGGSVSHPQNLAIFNYFDLKEKMKPLAEMPGEGPVVLADSSKLQDPRFGATVIAGERIEIVIDHHQESQVVGKNGKDRFVWIPPCGAATTPAWMLAKALGVTISEELATLAALGIYSDTNKLRSSRTTPEDRKAFLEAMELGSQETFSRCSAYLLPKRFRLLLAETLTHCAEIDAFRLAHPVSYLRDNEGDYLSIIADELHRYDGPRTTIVWGITGRKLRVCARSSSNEINLNDLIADMFGKGTGGGKHNASAGATVDLPELFVPTDETVTHLIAYVEARLVSKIEKLAGSRKKAQEPDDD